MKIDDFPKATVNVPMPEVKPTKDDTHKDNYIFKYNIPTYSWEDLNGKTLTIKYYEDDEGYCVVGKDSETGNVYLIAARTK